VAMPSNSAPAGGGLGYPRRVLSRRREERSNGAGLRVGLPLAVAVVSLTGGGLVAAAAEPAGSRPEPARHPVGDRNPCATPSIRKERGLLCPDLTISRPYDLQADRRGRHWVLRATSSINSVGRGPAELRGRRHGWRKMNASQRVHKKGGGKASFRTKAKLHFKQIPGQGRYWKFHNAARFELWSLDRRGQRKRRIAVGPKIDYCLRDLEHTGPGRPHSPASVVYPACSQNPNRDGVTLGTSVGWSDVYPAGYHEQFIRTKKVPHRGCFAFVMIVDPTNKILELDEQNNRSAKSVFLSGNGRYEPNRCKGARNRE
jgi:Lysyl oxidase